MSVGDCDQLLVLVMFKKNSFKSVCNLVLAKLCFNLIGLTTCSESANVDLQVHIGEMPKLSHLRLQIRACFKGS